MRFKVVNSEVYVAEEPIVKIGPDDIAFLKQRVLETPRGRVRLCAHLQSTDPLHEMIIALARSTYVRPHKHLQKSESFHIIEGIVDVVMFEDDGRIKDIVQLGEPGSGRSFYYRLSSAFFHTLIIRSDVLVIHETTNGPFKKDDAIFASWAPDENVPEAARLYMDNLRNSVAKFSPAAK